MDKVRIGDICTVVSGSTPKSNIEEYWNGDIKWITPAEIDGDSYVISDTERHITEKAVEKTNLTLLPVGTVLLSSRAPIGKTAIAGAEMYCNQGFKNLICSERIYNKYLYFFLTSKVDYLNALGRGATFKEISKGIVEDVEIPLPTIEVQKNIAKRLEVIQQLINNRKQALLQIDNLVKSRFVEMFGEPKSNPCNWKLSTIGEHCSVKGGKRVPKGMNFSPIPTKHPYLRVTDMKNATIIDDDIHYIDDEVYSKISRYVVAAGDVYLTNVGVNLGMAGVIPKKYDGANLTENAVKLINNESELDGIYLSHYINSPGIQTYVNERKMTVGVPKLAIFRIESMPLLLPPIDLQRKYKFFVQKADKSKLSIQQSIETLQTLKAKLMQDYFC